ncbi:hypothetical protein BDW02DRAFT_583569 [Decorospora gaudefroyi]|uniref:Uncharacterized protein n=1 Tax=Decorospora gaudefroyi TaxID=184978 RepID=A0A6A5JXL0_9PLEO|nr:hypothetical protein BDW02DRAFT_583569 [Decorospora gaudefroyi]
MPLVTWRNYEGSSRHPDPSRTAGSFPDCAAVYRYGFPTHKQFGKERTAIVHIQPHPLLGLLTASPRALTDNQSLQPVGSSKRRPLNRMERAISPVADQRKNCKTVSGLRYQVGGDKLRVLLCGLIYLTRLREESVVKIQSWHQQPILTCACTNSNTFQICIDVGGTLSTSSRSSSRFNTNHAPVTTVNSELHGTQSARPKADSSWIEKSLQWRPHRHHCPDRYNLFDSAVPIGTFPSRTAKGNTVREADTGTTVNFGSLKPGGLPTAWCNAACRAA